MASVTTLRSPNIDKDDNFFRRSYISVVVFAVVIFTILLIWQALAGRPASFQLTFNAFSVLSIASFVSNIVALVLILRIKLKSDVLVWFSTFLLSVAAWAAGEALIRMSATPEAAIFWSTASTPGSVIMSVSLFLFTLAYVRPNYYLQPLVMPVLLATAVLFIYVDNHTQLIAVYEVSKMTLTPWGYLAESGSAFSLLTLWSMLLPATCIALLYRFRKQAIDPILRKQAQLFMVAIAIPLIGGSITDGILPVLGVKILPPMSVMLLTITGAIISYGVFKYRFFRITPSAIAGQILNTINEAVIGVRPNFRINFVNGGAEKLFKLSAKQLSNKRLSDFWHRREGQSSLEDKIFTILQTTDTGTIESVQFRNADGVPFTAKVSVAKLNDESQPYGYLVVLTDITALAKSAAIIERKVAERTQELHEEQAKLRASIESLSLGFALVDPAQKIVIQNRALQRMFHFKQDEVTVEDLTRLLPSIDLGKEIMHVAKTHRPSEVKEVVMGAKVLHLFIAPLQIQVHHNNQTLGTVILVQDITEATVLERSRDEFFSIASHELRTPLTAIKGNASIMIDYYKEILDSDPSFKEMVVDMHSSSARLVDIVSDFLNVSRIEQGKMVFRLEAVELDKIIESIFYEMRTVIQDKKIKLETNTKTLGVMPNVWADKDRLTQVLYNIIGNAVKFTEKGGVRVEVAHNKKIVEVRVIDTGRGIAIPSQKLLFHKFQQAGDSLLTRDTTRGTGLGLYISRLIAEAMHGSVVLEKSEPDVGSTFLITIPIATKQQILSINAEQHTEKVDADTGLSRA